MQLKQPHIFLKSGGFILCFLLAPLFFYAQSLTGLWTGMLSNDSASVRKDQSFEIALTEYKGKVYGYSRNEFIVNDTIYYIVKRVKGTIEGDICEVVDDEIVSHNFPVKPEKKVKVISTFRKGQSDSAWRLDGKWKTKATKEYYSVSGNVSLSEEKDVHASKIFPHLEELNLAGDIAFYQERKEIPATVRIAKPERQQSEFNDNKEKIAAENTVASVNVQPPAISPVENKKEVIVAVNKDEDKQSSSEIAKAAVPDNYNNPPVEPAKNTTPVLAGNKKEETTKPASQVVKPPPPQPPIEKAATQKKNTETATDKPVIKQPEPVKPETEQAIALKKPAGHNDVQSKPNIEQAVPKPDIRLKAASVEGRKSEFTQEVSFRSDSLLIALYDNGVVDGDTVSVYMDGNIIMEKQGLKANALKKTIYIPEGTEEFTLVLFAENLGLYPPNTGLLVIRDGNDVYNLRFSADLQKNAGIVFKRKK